MLTRPPWIVISDAERRNIRYIWDDTRAMLDFKGDAGPVVGASTRMNLRARMVLCMGLYEWIVWRFEGLHTREEPVEIAEVGWCATVDPRYMRFFELTREEWRGPIEGPLWCAAMWLQPAMSKGYLFPKSIYDAISFLTREALHVLGNDDRFQAWLTAILPRLIENYPDRPDEPFVDPLNRRVAERLGPLIGRTVLDPTHQIDPQETRRFLSQTLVDARVSNNPFLAPIDELKMTGFVGAPYVIPPEDRH
jgi:hypothetical protein